MLVVGTLISYCYNNFLTQENIVGEYINRNYNHPPFLTEIPYVSDTLVLFKDNHFESPFWGKGSYKITYTIRGTEIQLVYKYEFGKAEYKSSVTRMNWKNPKIILDRNRDHYYERVTR